MTLPDRYRQTALANAWPMLDRLVARLCVLAGLASSSSSASLASAPLARVLRCKLLRLLRPAEALARRLVLLLARELPADAPASPVGKSARTPSQSRTAPGPQSSFRLFEPVAAFSANAVRGRRQRPPKSAGPRLLDLSGPFPQPAVQCDEPPAPRPCRLIARIRGLQRCLAAPERHAARLARAMFRRAASVAVFRRANPLRPGWPPGARSVHTPPEIRTLLSVLCFELRARPG